MDIVGLALFMILFFASYALMALIARVIAMRGAKRMGQEALDDPTGRKMRYIENWLKRGGPPPY